MLTYWEVMPEAPERVAFSEADVGGLLTVTMGATGAFLEGTIGGGALRFVCGVIGPSVWSSSQSIGQPISQ